MATDAEKNNFFNGQLYKGDLGQNFEKVKKIRRQGAPTSQNKQNIYIHYLRAPRGARDVKRTGRS